MVMARKSIKPKKVNKIKKGNDAEDDAKEVLEAQGWIVDKRCRVKFQNNDYFNLFDLVALRGSAIRFIQIKTNRTHYYSARREIARWAMVNELDVFGEVWLKLVDEKGDPMAWRKSVIIREVGKIDMREVTSPHESDHSMMCYFGDKAVLMEIEQEKL